MKKMLIRIRNIMLVVMAILIIIGNSVEAKGNGSNSACNWQHYKTNAFDGDNTLSCEYLYDNGENAKANICFVTENGVEYISIERHGDDLLVNEYFGASGESIYNEYAR